MEIRVRKAGPLCWVGFVVTDSAGVVTSAWTRKGAIRSVKKELRRMGIHHG